MCIPFGLKKKKKASSSYSSFIVKYDHRNEYRREVSYFLFINTSIYHDHSYLTVDGRGF